MKILTTILLLFHALLHAGEDHAPKRLSIQALLADRKQYDGHRVEVIGFFRAGFEVRALYETEADAKSAQDSKSIWLSTYSIKPGCESQIIWSNNCFVRVIGVFGFRAKLGSGHLGMWPAQISQIELIEPCGQKDIPPGEAAPKNTNSVVPSGNSAPRGSHNQLTPSSSLNLKKFKFSRPLPGSTNLSGKAFLSSLADTRLVLSPVQLSRFRERHVDGV